MGKLIPHPPVKLIFGFIYKKEADYLKTRNILSRKFGKIDFESPEFAFIHTDYYEKEFGPGLFRRFISFKKLIPAQRLAIIKLYTNKLESRFSLKGNRTVNLDPGYVDLAKLVLASAKNFSHRIYLGKEIYAEVTLYYEGGSFKGWPWTFPDYKTQIYIDLFNGVREVYAGQLKNK